MRKLRRNACPPATQDPELNAQNQHRTYQQYGYGPINPTQENTQFWLSKARRWKIPAALAFLRRCGNCGAYDISAEMQRCGGASPDGEVGYCRGHHFSCSYLRTCNTWSPGGPTK